MKKKKIISLLCMAALVAGLTGCKADESNLQQTQAVAPAQTQNEDTSSEIEEIEQLSMAHLLQTAIEPLGSTLYVWGGGWNEEDTGASIDTTSIGVSKQWKTFYESQDASYNYEDTRYQIHDGLDCSGYIGWLVYNVFETENGKPGYVTKSSQMAETFASYGWGDYTDVSKVSDWQTGDIMSMPGHVWMALGTCEDGSVLLLHASPPGVRFSGTLLADGSESQAVELARMYTQMYYPDWAKRYTSYGVDPSYLTKSSQMRWNSKTFKDAEQFHQMSPEEVMQWLFAGKKGKWQ